MKYILICNKRDGKGVFSEQSPSVLEHGAEARLKTYLEGVIRGLQIAGFRHTLGFRKMRVMVKDDVRYEFELLTEQEWKEY